MDRNHLNNFERGPTKDHSCEVWSKSNHWFRRRCCLKIVNGRTDGRRRRRRRTVSDHNISPWAFGSGELKTKWSKHQMNINIWKGPLRKWSKNPSRQISSFACVPKETLVTVEYIDKQWKSWSECADVLSDLGILCLHNTQSPFFII